MSARNCYGPWLTLLTLVLVVVLLRREMRRLNTAESLLEAAMRRQEQVRIQVMLADERVAHKENEQGSRARNLSGTDNSDVTFDSPGRFEAAAASRTMSLRAGVVRPEVAVATDSGLWALHLQVFDEGFDGVWGGLLRQLNLSEEKLAAFKALLRANEERRLDVTAVAGEQNLDFSDPAVLRLRSDDDALLIQKMRELLGPEDAKIYQQFRRDLALQTVITDMAARTYSTPTPLTLSESQQLLAILSANTGRLPNGFARVDAVKWDTALAAVETSGAFSPALVAGFRQLAEEHRLAGQLDQRINEILTGPIGKAGYDEVWMPGFPPLTPKPVTGPDTISKSR